MALSLKRHSTHRHARDVAALYYSRRGYVPLVLLGIIKATESDAAFRAWQARERLFKSNPDQPHVPAGLTTGGQFTSDGTNGGVPTGWGGDPNKFQNHYNKHKKDFGAKTPEDYVDQANAFYQKFQDEKLPAVQDVNGYTKIFDPNSNSFGVYNPDGDPVTFYKPTSPTYFNRELQNVVDGGGQVINPYPSEGGSGGGGGGFSTGKPGDIIHEPWDILE